MGTISEGRARALTFAALKKAIPSGGLLRASDGKVWVLVIFLDPDGAVRTVLNEEDRQTVNAFIQPVTMADWTRWTAAGPVVWVLCLLFEGNDSFCEAYELLVLREEDKRFCLFFDEAGTQCRQSAPFVCLDADGLMWTGCGSHADSHRWLRMPLAKFLHLARTGQTATSFWEPGPSSSDEACAWVRHIGQLNGISWPTGGEQKLAGLGSTEGKARDA